MRPPITSEKPSGAKSWSYWPGAKSRGSVRRKPGTTLRGTWPGRCSPRGSGRARSRGSSWRASACRAIVRTRSSLRWIAGMEETDPDAAVVPATPDRADPVHWPDHVRSRRAAGAAGRGHDDRAVAVRRRRRLVRESVGAAEPAEFHPRAHEPPGGDASRHVEADGSGHLELSVPVHDG